jgi:hypothetical protein
MKNMFAATKPLSTWFAAVLLVAGGASGFSQDSPVNTAPYRLRIETAPNTAWPASVGMVEVTPFLEPPGPFGVFNEAGKPVPFQSFWSAGGEPTALRFDTASGERTYYVCFGANLPEAAGGWKPQAGVFLETRGCTEQRVNSFSDINQMFAAAGPAQGRGYVPDIFLGMNPFGPSEFYTAIFNGWFEAPTAGRYGFATVSAGASYLQVDGQTVAEWLGTHSPQGGRRGQHGGEIQLRAGLHHLEYVQVQFGGEAAAEAAWKPPHEDHFVLLPASAFTPVARFRAANFACRTSSEPVYFEWHTMDHSALEDAMVVRVRFRALDNGQHREYRWRFDDGSEGAGQNLQHIFPQPGSRLVRVEAWEHGRLVATNSLRIRVAPNWLQRDWWREDIFNEARDDFLHRDLDRTPARDLTAMLTLADRADDRELPTHVGEAMIKRAGEFATHGDGIMFYKLGVAFEHQGDTGDSLAEKCFRLALTPERSLMAVADKVKLRLADLLIHCSGGLDEAGKLLGEIHGSNLTGDERRLLKLVQGDLWLARGKPEEARSQYVAAGMLGAGGNAEVTRAARLESANILLEHDQLEDAQRVLNQALFELPLERMSPGSGLLEIELAMKQKEFQRAYTTCHRLLPVAEGDPRQSQILYALIESSQALGKTDEARAALTKLLKEFPYSESAAKAKEQGPARVGQPDH